METTRLDTDDTRTTLSDDAGEWAICELVQRAAWARELGLDPRAGWTSSRCRPWRRRGRSARRRRRVYPVG